MSILFTFFDSTSSFFFVLISTHSKLQRHTTYRTWLASSIFIGQSLYCDISSALRENSITMVITFTTQLQAKVPDCIGNAFPLVDYNNKE